MIRVRAALLSDLDAVRQVSTRNGLSEFDPQQRKKWWLSHPFRQEFEGTPIGWILEKDDGEIVGTFSNIHMMYEMDGRRLKCAIAGSWGVDPEYRNSSLLLAMSYFGQKEVDFCLNGSASSVASRLMAAMRAERVPSWNYDLSYFWIASHRAFAAAVLQKKGIPCGQVVSYPVGLALKTSDLVTRISRHTSASLNRFHTFGTEFDELWEDLRREDGRLRAIRSAAVLEWRFGQALRQGKAIVLGMLQGERLCGYIILSEKERENLRLKQFVVADLQALNDSRAILFELLSAAIDTTQRQGLDALEWQGWNSAKRQVALALKPRSYRYPVWPLFYKTTQRDLCATLANANSWDCSPFDAF